MQRQILFVDLLSIYALYRVWIKVRFGSKRHRLQGLHELYALWMNSTQLC